MRLQEVAPGLNAGAWIAEGAPITAALGFRYPIRMAVLRLDDGRLVLWSPVQAEPELVDEIAALGPVAGMIAPNRLHHSFLADWAHAFPRAEIHAAPGLRAKRPDLVISGEITDVMPPGWAGLQAAFVPNSLAPEAVIYHVASGTVLVADLLQNMPAEWYRGWRRLIARMDRMIEWQPTMPRKFRLALSGEAAAGVKRITDWPARQLVVAHGTAVTGDAQAFLRGALTPG